MKEEEKDYIEMHDQLTGDPVRFRIEDTTEIWFVLRRMLESFENGKAHWKKYEIFKGKREDCEVCLKQLKQDEYLLYNLNLDVTVYPPTQLPFVKWHSETSTWEIGMISVFKMHAINNGAKPVPYE